MCTHAVRLDAYIIRYCVRVCVYTFVYYSRGWRAIVVGQKNTTTTTTTVTVTVTVIIIVWTSCAYTRIKSARHFSFFVSPSEKHRKRPCARLTWLPAIWYFDTLDPDRLIRRFFLPFYLNYFLSLSLCFPSARRLLSFSSVIFDGPVVLFRDGRGKSRRIVRDLVPVRTRFVMNIALYHKTACTRNTRVVTKQSEPRHYPRARTKRSTRSPVE